MFSRITNRPWLLITLTAILVACTVFFIARSAYTWERSRGVLPSFYQSYYEPAIRMACGQPFGIAKCNSSLDPACQLSEEMRRFLKTEQQTLACESVSLPEAIENNPPARAWYHMFVMTAQIWKFTGISWSALNSVPAALIAISALFVFFLFRLLMPMPIAATLAVVSILPSLQFLPYLRDINKAPFILGALFVTVWLALRTPARKQLYLAMAATGLWLGIGYGFRPDALIVLPLLFATILFFRPAPLKEGWIEAILSLAILLGSFMIAASPVLSAFNANVGSCQWHFGLLGLSDVHTGILGITPAGYSWLNHYDDLAAWRAVESYGDRVLSIASTGYCTPLYDQASRALYLEIFKTFPADFLTRGLAAAKTVIRHEFWQTPWLEFSSSWQAFFISYRSVFSGVFFSGWIAIVLIALANSVRVGLFAIFSLAYLSMYPAIQFDHRHFFHLTFLAWLPIGIISGWLACLFVLALRRGQPGIQIIRGKIPTPSAWLRGLVILGSVAGIAYGGISWARHEQNGTVNDLFEHYLRAGGDTALIKSRENRGENVVLTIRPPENKKDRYVYGHMLRLDIGGEKCRPGMKTMTTELGNPDDPASVFKKELAFSFNTARTQAAVFSPAYFQRGSISTIALALRQADIDCVQNIQWLHSDELPSLWVRATLYPDWRESRLYQSR